ncbi:MAG TPA: 4-hydroxythreonine-4-phosphate dehydrogenase, partial [Gammaproteobacteria bacterium]|nr:4-hydroxythreonine-4-phosphate dehydrogenase [Gammaproteobacteria bacterium]
MPVARIVLTAGEPGGIGPELCLRIAQQPASFERVVVADRELLESRARQLGLPIELDHHQPGQPAQPQRAGELKILPVPLSVPAVAG